MRARRNTQVLAAQDKRTQDDRIKGFLYREEAAYFPSTSLAMVASCMLLVPS